MNVQNEIDRAFQFGRQLEELVVHRGQCSSVDRDVLLIGYWALLFDFHKGILTLLSSKLFGGAFALVRPVVEALVRAHLVLMGSQEDILKLQQDEYRVNFAEVGSQIDEAFGLEGFFKNFLTTARNALHSYTHAGVLQLGRRFEGNELKPRYSDEEIGEVIRTTTLAVFMVTSLVTKRFSFEEEWQQSSQMFDKYLKQR